MTCVGLSLPRGEKIGEEPGRLELILELCPWQREKLGFPGRGNHQEREIKDAGGREVISFPRVSRKNWSLHVGLRTRQAGRRRGKAGTSVRAQEGGQIIHHPCIT